MKKPEPKKEEPPVEPPAKKAEPEVKKLEPKKEAPPPAKIEEPQEIEEEIVDSDKENPIEEPPGKRAFTESGGLTGSASIGLDPSVDSMALEEYDYIEPIEKVSQP